MTNDIIYTETDNIATITLNRVAKHNAFTSDIVVQLTQIYEKVNTQDNVRIVVLKANGKHFSAGADLDWMRSMKDFSREQNEEDAMLLANLLKTINQCSKPTIAITQGKVMGGAVGLTACCDFVLAYTETQYCFSEVKLGLIPATIAPYVVRKMGYSLARSYFISAEFIDAALAKNSGLIYQIADNDDHMKALYETLTQQLLLNAPQAMTAAKLLVECLEPIGEELQAATAKLLAELRVSDEAQQRLTQFLERKK